jgi:glycosyltransferase involved in cell wall biosynthesis
LINWLEQWQPDILIMEANPRYLEANSAIKWMHARNKKVIGWGLGSPDPTGLFSSFRKSLRSRFIKKFDALITYSQKGADEYQLLGFEKEKVIIAPNAVAVAPKQKAIARPAKFELNRATILFVGRLQTRKKVDLLIRACAGVKLSAPPMLWIVGDGPARKTLEVLAREVYPDTQFYGAVHGRELQALYERADLFVLPGTGGLAVQEAMSYSLPVIVGAADGTQSNLVSEKNGWTFVNETVDELSDLIDSALSDVKTLRNKGRASYQIVKNEVNLEIMVREFIRAIDVVSGVIE